MVKPNTNNYEGVIFILIVVVIALIMFTLFVLLEKNYVLASIFGMGAFVFIVLILSLISNYQQEKYIPQQKVIINESVSFEKFINKYNIIEQEGKIFTVQPKQKSK
jgi:hypothetical protein